MRSAKNCRRSWSSSWTRSREKSASRSTRPQEGQVAVESRIMNIESARALVTGGSSGIGLATARLLASRGARVAICGRDRAKLERAAKEIGALAVPADVSREGDR